MRFASAAIALALVTLVPATVRAQSWEEYRPAGIADWDRSAIGAVTGDAALRRLST